MLMIPVEKLWEHVGNAEGHLNECSQYTCQAVHSTLDPTIILQLVVTCPHGVTLAISSEFMENITKKLRGSPHFTHLYTRPISKGSQ
jgi:hypothetical protein